LSPLIPYLQSIWRRMPVSRSLRSALGPALWHILTIRGRANLKRTLDPARVVPGPLVISACISDVTGIGRAGRLTLKAAEAWGAPIISHDIPADPEALRVSQDLPPGGVWLAHCNPPEAIAVLSQKTEHLWATRYRIGYWAYELGKLPRGWEAAIPFFHEIWTPSRFVADAVERARGRAGTIVRVVPHPVAVDPPPQASVRTGRPLTFLVMFDARSSLARKNPLGAIRAFQQAFAPDDMSVRLHLKIVAAWKDPRSVGALRNAAEGWRNIGFSEEELSDAETLQLFASADCLVSLHRAEGFGLPLAEAMLAGLPAIATDWSGNVDFTRGASYEVPCSLVPARDSSGRYSGTGQTWAEPDLGAAAAQMRKLRDDPAGREAITRLGQQRIRQLCDGLPIGPVAALLTVPAAARPEIIG
jgi:glycosyltransferase involved in cell wall biosynthesis